jgi:uncharacterized protein YndB with AHSA1/START domain
MNLEAPGGEDLVLEIERRIALPTEQLFELWTDPEHFREWWGPSDDDGRPFTVFFHEADIRDGGAWRVGMRAPDGKEYWQRGIYQAIERPSRLAFTFTWESDDPELAEMLIDVSFHADGDSTLMRFRQSRLLSRSSRDGHRVGWERCFDRLGIYAGHRRKS